MAEMLPYLLGFFPDDSIVVVGLHGPQLEQGGVVRLDIPDDPDSWPSVAADTVRLLIDLSEQRDRRPEQALIYLCHDPADGDTHAAISRLSPLAVRLAEAFRADGVKVRESLGISAGRWWSFLCWGTTCCGPQGTQIRSAHVPSAIAAAATFAGLAPRGSRKAITAELLPITGAAAEIQRSALHRATPELIRALRGGAGHAAVLDRTSALIDEAMAEFAAGADEIDPDRTALLLSGLQDRLGRDRGAEYAEPYELATAQRLWRFLAQRCVAPFEHFGAAPLTLLAWTSWLAADSATARIVLSRALDLDPDYTLAQLIYESLNAGLLPDELLDSIRAERAARRPPGRVPVPRPRAPHADGPPDTPSGEAGPSAPPGAPPQTGERSGGAPRVPSQTTPTGPVAAEPRGTVDGRPEVDDTPHGRASACRSSVGHAAPRRRPPAAPRRVTGGGAADRTDPTDATDRTGHPGATDRTGHPGGTRKRRRLVSRAPSH